MKVESRSRNSQHFQAGLSWFRVLVTVAILLVLLGVASIISRLEGRRPVDNGQTRTMLQMIRLKLEDYGAEHDGIYPVGEDSSSAVLYRVLPETM